MPKLPRVSGAEVVRALERLGFSFARQRGSHAILRKITSTGTVGCVVPLHPELAIATLRGICGKPEWAKKNFSKAFSSTGKHEPSNTIALFPHIACERGVDRCSLFRSGPADHPQIVSNLLHHP
jgi:predicted RNA binding protein YcfA (HicA-like mRNA interferase family)